eukprot:5570932-Pleurochrysis_carterae.AAC.1
MKAVNARAARVAVVEQFGVRLPWEKPCWEESTAAVAHAASKDEMADLMANDKTSSRKRWTSTSFIRASWCARVFRRGR